MRVLLIATGENYALAPLTDSIPSPMMPVVNRPVMEHNIELLSRQGFKEIVVSLHHLGGSVEAYFGMGRRWGVEIDYLLQREAWGDAGAIKWAAANLTERFLVIPADRLIDMDLSELVARHDALQSQATVVLHAEGNGCTDMIGMDEVGKITSVSQKRDGWHAWHNTGVYLFEPEILDYIPARTHCEIHRQLLPRLLTEGVAIHGCQTRGYWNTLASFEAYEQAQVDWLSTASGHNNGHVPASRHPKIEGQSYGPGIWVGRNNVIHPSARIRGPVCIGDNCQIGREVEIGPYAVIGPNVIIDDEATIQKSTVLQNTYVGQLVNIENRFVNKGLMVDAATSESTTVVDNFLLSEATPTIVGHGFRRIWEVSFALILWLVTAPVWIPAGLLMWLINGRLLDETVYHAIQLETLQQGTRVLDSGQPAGIKQVQLSRLSTRRKDGSVSGLGRWVRRLGLDHLVALWNVIRGDIALVGVKPLTSDEADQVSEEWQRQRYDYLAGWTGQWFIQTARTSDLLEVFVADAYYVATRSWQGDVKLLLNTPRAWWERIKGG